jgi:type II secretory pathway component PulF
MQDFAYVARDTSGQKISGTLSAASERDALNMLSGKALFPIQVTAQKQKVRSGLGRVKGQTMAIVYAQLASLLRSGVPLLRSLAVIQQQASNETLKRVIGEVHDRVEQGETLGESISRYPRVFNEMAVNMVRAGGEGGFLEEALDRVAQFTEQQEDLKSRTVGALAYPVFLGIVGSTIVAALVIFFVPKFGELFDSLRERGELPVLTDWLLWFSASLKTWGIVFLVFFIAAVLLIRARLATEEGKRFRDLVKLKVPLLGAVFKNLAVARFCRVLGTLLRNGVPILKSLEISRRAAGNRILSEAIADASENISAGESLATPLGESGHFPMTVVEMISVAEESNTLDKVLVEIADGLEKQTSRRLDLAVRLLEPMMLLVLAGAVLFVVIALLLPVIKMSSTI